MNRRLALRPLPVLLLLFLSTSAVADTRSWFASVPRADWPCTGVEKGPDRSDAVLTFHYGTRTRCKLPVDLAHYTLTGCPTHITYEDGAQTITFARFTYDKPGRLVSHVDDEGETTPIDWKTGEPRVPGALAPKTRGRTLEWGNGELRIDVSAKSRPLRATTTNTATDPPRIDERMTYEWKGHRLIGVRTERPAETYTLELSYACRKRRAD